MKKLEREIKRFLKQYPGWRLRKRMSGSDHYIVTNGDVNITCACTPKSVLTVIKNLRQRIARYNRGQPL